MKYLIPLLLLPVLAFAQPKKATKIIVSSSDSISQIASILYENGFSVESRDVNFIASTEKSYRDYSIKIRAVKKDSTITFTGLIALNVTLQIGNVYSARTFDTVNYSGMKKSPLMKAWKELESIAKKVGVIIKYE